MYYALALLGPFFLCTVVCIPDRWHAPWTFQYEKSESPKRHQENEKAKLSSDAWKAQGNSNECKERVTEHLEERGFIIVKFMCTEEQVLVPVKSSLVTKDAYSTFVAYL